VAGRARLEPGTESSVSLARLLAIGSVVAAWACVGGFAVVAAPVLIAWLGSGAQEPLVDVLSVAGAGWLLGLGATMSAGEATWGLTPLGLTLLSLVLAYRGGLWAAESSGPLSSARVAALLGSTALTSAAIGGVTASAMSLDGLSVDPGEAAAQAGLVIATGAGAGVLAIDATWRRRVAEHLPGWLTAALRPALAALAVLAAGAAAVTTAALVGSFGTMTSLLEQLDPGGAGLLALTMTCLGYLPTLMVWTLAVLLGPGVSLGSEVTVTLWAVDGGPLPGFPLLGVVPEAIPGWLPAVGALTVAGAGLAAGMLVSRRSGPQVRRWELSATAGTAGLLVGVAVAVTAWAASGPMGPGDLSWLGVNAAAVGGLAGVAVALAATLTATARAWRRGDYRPSLADSDSFSVS
jgi:hypothetical protein